MSNTFQGGHSFIERLSNFKGKKSYGPLDCIKSLCKRLKRANLENVSETFQMVSLLNTAFQEMENHEELCMVLREYGFIKSSVNLLVLLKEVDWFKDDKVWSIVYNLFGALWSYSNYDAKLNISSDHQLIKILLENMLNEKFHSDSANERFKDIIAATVSISYNLKQNNSDLFNEYKDLLMPVCLKLITKNMDEQIEIVLILFLTNLSNEINELICLNEPKEILTKFMCYLNNSANSNEKCHNGFYFVELIKCLEKMIGNTPGLIPSLFENEGLDTFIKCVDIAKIRFNETEITIYLQVCQLLLKNEVFNEKLKDNQTFNDQMKLLEQSRLMTTTIIDTLHRKYSSDLHNSLNKSNTLSKVVKKYIYVSCAKDESSSFDLIKALAKHFFIWQNFHKAPKTVDYIIRGINKSYAIVILLSSAYEKDDLNILELEIALENNVPLTVVMEKSRVRLNSWVKILPLVHEHKFSLSDYDSVVNNVNNAKKQMTRNVSRSMSIKSPRTINLIASKSNKNLTNSLLTFLDEKKLSVNLYNSRQKLRDIQDFANCRLNVLLLTANFIRSKTCPKLWQYLHLMSKPMLLVLLPNVTYNLQQWKKISSNNNSKYLLIDPTNQQVSHQLVYNCISHECNFNLQSTNGIITQHIDKKTWLDSLKLQFTDIPGEFTELNSETLMKLKALVDIDLNLLQWILKSEYKIEKPYIIGKIISGLRQLDE